MMPRRDLFTFGWICTTSAEYLLARQLLDEEHAKPLYNSQDQNVYAFGRIHEHNLVVACLPRETLMASAQQMQTTFPKIRFNLLVGVAAGVPSADHDIRLGDVVVSYPSERYAGYFEYDFEEAIENYELKEQGSLMISPELIVAVTQLQSAYDLNGNGITEAIMRLPRDEHSEVQYSRPTAEFDQLYQTLTDGQESLLTRADREDSKSYIHYGIIASAKYSMSNGRARDTLAAEANILCFDRGITGLNSDFSCLVIRGIHGYSGMPENDEWQHYAIAAAAVYAKDVLRIMPAFELASMMAGATRQQVGGTMLVTPQSQSVTLSKNKSNDDQMIEIGLNPKRRKFTQEQTGSSSSQDIINNEDDIVIPTISPDEDWLAHPRKLIAIKSEIRSTIKRMSLVSKESNLTYPGQSRIGKRLHIIAKRPFLDNLELHNGPANGFYKFRKLISYHRRLAWIALMLIYLQTSRLIDKSITILTQRDLKDNLVDLVSLSVHEIFVLIENFDALLFNRTDNWKGGPKMTKPDLMLHCYDLLDRCTMIHPQRENFEDVQFWSRLSDLLELAIISHTHAHRASLWENEDNYVLPIASQLDSGWTLHLRQASCLSGFFADDKLFVWKMHRPTQNGIESPVAASVAIRTKISTFNEVWGPVYRVIEADKTIQYNVGRGCIVPWYSHDSQRLATQDEATAVNAHWLPYNLMQECWSLDQAIQADDTSSIRSDVLLEDDQRSSETESIASDTGDISVHHESTVVLSEDNPYYDGAYHHGSQYDTIALHEDVGDVTVDNYIHDRAQYAREHPFDAWELLVIGAFRQHSTALLQTQCDCSPSTIRNKHVQRNLDTREPKTIIQRGPYGVSIGWSGSALSQSFVPTPNDRFYAEALLDRWEHYPARCHPEQLSVMGGVKISSCTGNAIRCSILDLLTTPAMRRIIEQMAESSMMDHVRSSCWDLFLNKDISRIIQTWKDQPRMHLSIIAIIRECITLLTSSGLDKARSSFNALWMPPDGTIPRRVVLDPKDHDWLNLLRNGPDACAFGVLVEGCYSIRVENQPIQLCGQSKQLSLRSVLQTNMLFDNNLRPFSGSRVEKGVINVEKRYPPIELPSGLFNPPFGSQIWLQYPFERLILVGATSSRHLILQWSPSMSQKMLNTILINPITGAGHREVFELEDQNEDALMVHIRRGRAADGKQKASESKLQTVLTLL